MVSHLLFADDSLILMNADKKNADCLRNLLDRYCQSSGQMLSVNKSSIFFLGEYRPGEEIGGYYFSKYPDGVT